MHMSRYVFSLISELCSVYYIKLCWSFNLNLKFETGNWPSGECPPASDFKYWWLYQTIPELLWHCCQCKGSNCIKLCSRKSSAGVQLAWLRTFGRTGLGSKDELEAPRGVTVTRLDEFLVADIRKSTLIALKLDPKTGSRLEHTVVTGFHRPYLVFMFMYLADAFIQSDLQMKI